MVTFPALPVLVRWRPEDEKLTDIFRYIVSLRPSGATDLSQTRKMRMYNKGSVESSGRLPALCSVHPCAFTVNCSLLCSSFTAVWITAVLWGR